MVTSVIDQEHTSPANGALELLCSSKKHTQNEKGDRISKGYPRTSNLCKSYCDVCIYKDYGGNQPFAKAYCGENTQCSLPKGSRVTLTNGYRLGWDKAYDDGASYTWIKSATYKTSVRWEKTLRGGQCGFWTFVLIFIS
jgi:hypothetical protein